MWSVWCLLLISMAKRFSCNPVTNDFNSNLREYAVKENADNVTNVKTLQKEELGRYAGFVPAMNPIRFKEVPDNAISGSTHSRGLSHHSGYGIHDYDESHGYGYSYEYPIDHHGHDIGHHGHHGPSYYGHLGYHGHGYHHKYHDPVLATKAILLPIAGIALLGAAAALASNPVLLQLGVISGRRRRDTEEVDGPGLPLDFSKFAKRITSDNGKGVIDKTVEDKRRVPKQEAKRVSSQNAKRPIRITADDRKRVPEVETKDDHVVQRKKHIIIGEDENDKLNFIAMRHKSEKRLTNRRYRDAKRQILSASETQTPIDVAVNTPIHNEYFQEDRYIPIRLKTKSE